MTSLLCLSIMSFVSQDEKMRVPTLSDDVFQFRMDSQCEIGRESPWSGSPCYHQSIRILIQTETNVNCNNIFMIIRLNTRNYKKGLTNQPDRRHPYNSDQLRSWKEEWNKKWRRASPKPLREYN